MWGPHEPAQELLVDVPTRKQHLQESHSGSDAPGTGQAAGPRQSGLPPSFSQRILERPDQWCEPEHLGDSTNETNVFVLMELPVSSIISCRFHNLEA